MILYIVAARSEFFVIHGYFTQRLHDLWYFCDSEILVSEVAESKAFVAQSHFTQLQQNLQVL